MGNRGGKRKGAGRKPEEKSKRFCKLIKETKYDLFCEIWKQFKNEHLKCNNK